MLSGATLVRRFCLFLVAAIAMFAPIGLAQASRPVQGAQDGQGRRRRWLGLHLC